MEERSGLAIANNNEFLLRVQGPVSLWVGKLDEFWLTRLGIRTIAGPISKVVLRPEISGRSMSSDSDLYMSTLRKIMLGYVQSQRQPLNRKSLICNMSLSSRHEIIFLNHPRNLSTCYQMSQVDPYCRCSIGSSSQHIEI